MKANEILVEVMKNTMMQDGKQYTQARMAEELSAKSDKKVRGGGAHSGNISR